MEQKASAAERVRPILRAMELSINRARRQRTDVNETEPRHSYTPSEPRVAHPQHQAIRPETPRHEPVEQNEPPRLKARPKRRFLTN